MGQQSPFSWLPHIIQDVWAAMLEDRKWTNQLFTQNQILMAENYALVTSFLREHDIGYYEM